MTAGAAPPPPERTELDGAVTVSLPARAPFPPVVEVTLNGAGPFLLLLDTGLGASFAIDRGLANELDLPAFGTTRVRTLSGGTEMSLTRVETLGLDRASFHGCTGVIGDFSLLGEVIDVRGMIGLPLFAACLVTLDGPGGTLTLASGALPAADGEEVLDCRFRDGTPAMTLVIGDAEYEAVIDTGSESTVLAKAMTRHVTTEAPPVIVSRYVDAAGRTDSRAAARLAGAMRLGRHVVERPIIDIGGRVNIVGWSILARFETTFDRARQRVRLHRDGDDPVRFEPLHRPGFGVRFTGEGLVVAYVLPGSSAGTAGLREGDVIVAVDDRPARALGAVEWRRRRESPGTLHLRVRRGEEIVEFAVEVAVVVE